LVAPLVYNSANRAPQPATQTETTAAPATSTASAPPQPAAQKNPGFFSKLGRFFKRIFGAE
jgi:hypothetical protein